jgi:hypothetical protein
MTTPHILRTTCAVTFIGLCMLILGITLRGTQASAAEPTVGHTISTTETVRVRVLPGTTEARRGLQGVGARGVVVGGPVTANGYTWYNIDFAQGVDGWVAGPYVVSVQPQVLGATNSKIQDQINVERKARELSNIGKQLYLKSIDQSKGPSVKKELKPRKVKK